MIATDSIFNPGKVVYSTNPGRDLEFNYDGDACSISADRYTLSLTMYGHNGGQFDEARVILAMPPALAVPGLDGLGLLILAVAFAALGTRLARNPSRS